MAVFCIHNDFQGTVCFSPKSSESLEWACFSPWGRQGGVATDPWFLLEGDAEPEKDMTFKLSEVGWQLLRVFPGFFNFNKEKEENYQNL